eukprot:scaffold310275_cov24-Prasinocladus_malaysianus.AAC.1
MDHHVDLEKGNSRRAEVHRSPSAYRPYYRSGRRRRPRPGRDPAWARREAGRRPRRRPPRYPGPGWPPPGARRSPAPSPCTAVPPEQY